MPPRHAVPVPEPPDRPRVLVVDHDDARRAATARTLAEAGCEVIEAGSYGGALTQARSAAPSVIVTERYGGSLLELPEYVASLRRFAEVPVILLAAVVEPGEAGTAGLWAAIARDAAPGVLRDAVWLAHSSTRQAARQ
jgi:CheY-like chemotaxis protein